MSLIGENDNEKSGVEQDMTMTHDDTLRPGHHYYTLYIETIHFLTRCQDMGKLQIVNVGSN